MAIIFLSIKGFRNIKDTTLSLGKTNIIYGDNGSGKTSFLETIFFLARGKSFRTNKQKNLINLSSDNFVLFAKTKTNRIGITKVKNDSLKIKVNQEFIKNLSSLSKTLPIQLITPDCHKLIDGGPNERRKYIDWLVFHVKHDLIHLWKKHQKILKQRNLSLRNKLPPDQINIWDSELSRVTEVINSERKSYLDKIRLLINKYSKQIFEENYEFDIFYEAGWDDNLGFSSSLEKKFISDQKKGFTQIGLNKSDIKLYVVIENQKMEVKEYLSKGNIKLLSILLILIQLKIYTDNIQTKEPILLIDDIFAELDKKHTIKILSYIYNLNLQSIITTVSDTSSIPLPDNNQKDNLSMFHVKHGEFYQTNI